MDLVIVISWGFLFLATPVVLLAAAVRAYDGANAVELIAKLLISLVGYFFVSIAALIFSVGVLLGGDGRSGKGTPEAVTLFAVAVVYLYALAGYLLGSFIKGGFLKPWLVFRSKKTLSVFDSQ
jgi:hypothetical protein